MSTSSITFPVSDGDFSHRPLPGSRHVVAPREAQANYRAKVGKGIAKDLEGYRPGMQYILQHLPEGYQFYERPRPPGHGKVMIDRYLYGHPSHYVFLSSCEFIPHARWLATNQKGECPCLGCNGGRKPKKGTRSQRRAPRPSVVIKIDAPSPTPPLSPLSSTDGPVVKQESSAAPNPQQEPPFTKLFSKLKAERVIETSIERPGEILKNTERLDFDPSLSDLSERGAFVPRLGELVLYLSPSHLQGHPSGPEGPYHTRSVGAKPVWKAGLVTQLPQESLPPFELADITEPNPDRLPHLKDRKLWEFLPFQSLRPFCFHEEILAASKLLRQEWHPSILHALKSNSSFSLVSPTRFQGTWPDANITHGGLYLGSELIVVGDVIRIATPIPSTSTDKQQVANQDFRIDALSVTSIVLIFSGLDLDIAEPKDPPNHTRVTGDNCQRIRVRVHGKLFTRATIFLPNQIIQEGKGEGLSAVKSSHVPPVLQSSDSNWIPVGWPDKIVSAPLTHVLGRMYEDEAIGRYGIAPPLPVPTSPPTEEGEGSHDLQASPPAIAPADLGVSGVLSGRDFARRNFKPLVQQIESSCGEGNKLWFWGNDRVEALFGPE